MKRIIPKLVEYIIVRCTFFLIVSCAYDHVEKITLSKCAGSTLTIAVGDVKSTTTCGSADGSITVNASGGSGSYAYSINNGASQTSNAFINLSSGSYTLAVRDSLGCVASQLVSVNSGSSTLSVSVLSTVNSGCPTANGTITVTASGGTEPYQYKINSGSYQSSNLFTALNAGNYSVTVNDASNCPTSLTTTVSRKGPSFVSDISPIISANCATSGCHNGSRSPTLTSYSTIASNASRVLSTITSRLMPPGGSLSQTQINLITCWVNDGAKNN